MELPKVKTKKINRREFIKLGERVRKIFEEEAKLLHDEKVINDHFASTGVHSHFRK